MPHIQRSQEAEAFLDARQHFAAEAVSACEGWTAHEVTAHLAAAAAEVTRHLEPYLDGSPVPATRSFEEREAPYRAMTNTELLRRLEAEEHRAQVVIGQVLDREPNAAIPWTGRQMVVAKFVPHLRNEFAIHRWDIVGDDDTSTKLLSQPELTEHAVGVLGQILLRRGRSRDPVPNEDFHLRLRAPGTPDVRVIVESGLATLQLPGTRADEPCVELDPAARTLLIWGRRPAGGGRVRSYVPQAMLARLQALLSGY